MALDLKAMRRAARGDLPALPLSGALDARWSAISSLADAPGQPTDELVGLALAAAELARTTAVDDLAARCTPDHADLVNQWPGEHYRFLAALTATTRPARIVEIGTSRGHGAYAMLSGHPEAHITTYDIEPLSSFDYAVLDEADLAGPVEQRIGDLGDADYRATQLDTLRAADLYFIDGPKDGAWEQHAVPDILADLTDRRRLIVFDDVRLVEMVQVWRDLPYAKLDVTRIGHWSGTGLLHTA